MRVFIDTSAILALRIVSDAHHQRAKKAFARLRAQGAALITTSYVLCETLALLGYRFGLEEVREFRRAVAPLLDVIWVDQRLHEKGLDLLLERGKRDISLVDAVSFIAIREERLDDAFVFDRHFGDEGFRCS